MIDTGAAGAEAVGTGLGAGVGVAGTPVAGTGVGGAGAGAGTATTNVNPVGFVTFPQGVVTVTGTFPAVWASVTAVIFVGPVTLKDFAAEPNETAVAPAIHLPVMTTVVPPVAGPVDGVMVVMDGFVLGCVAAVLVREKVAEPSPDELTVTVQLPGVAPAVAVTWTSPVALVVAVVAERVPVTAPDGAVHCVVAPTSGAVTGVDVQMKCPAQYTLMSFALSELPSDSHTSVVWLTVQPAIPPPIGDVLAIAIGVRWVHVVPQSVEVCTYWPMDFRDFPVAVDSSTKYEEMQWPFVLHDRPPGNPIKVELGGTDTVMVLDQWLPSQVARVGTMDTPWGGRNNGVPHCATQWVRDSHDVRSSKPPKPMVIPLITVGLPVTAMFVVAVGTVGNTPDLTSVVFSVVGMANSVVVALATRVTITHVVVPWTQPTPADTDGLSVTLQCTVAVGTVAPPFGCPLHVVPFQCHSANPYRPVTVSTPSA